MKLIRQRQLIYLEGASEKVYEVDLCEIGPGRFVVNFRYGKRGAVLKEGTRTVAPVGLPEAETIFSEVVSSRLEKGYVDAAEAARSAQTGRTSGARLTPAQPLRAVTTGPMRRVDITAREQALLQRLAEAQAAPRRPGLIESFRTAVRGATRGAYQWPLERVIWRAGEMKLRAATPYLLNLIGSGDAMRDYCIAWALGWCGDESVVSALGNLFGNRSAPEHVRRIACEALLKLSDEATRAEFRSDMLEQLPEELRGLARTGPSGEFGQALQTFLNGNEPGAFQVLELCYLIDNAHVRPALLEILRSAPFQPNYFQRIRHIFKMAEYRRDAEVFGMLAYRFETTPTLRLYRDPWTGQIHLPDGKAVKDLGKELKSPHARFAYTVKTRTYLRTRIWRTLRRMAELEDTDYVKMAVGVLLQYRDADAKPVRETTYESWRRGQSVRVRWDAFAGYLTFNHILYSNSPRYEYKPNRSAWRCQSRYRPGDPAPPVREEAFPNLWERVPVGLLHLLSESECRPVHEFAVKALRDCPQFCADLDVEAIVMLLERVYPVTAQFGFELAQTRYQVANPDLHLVLAVANCSFEPARKQARIWIDTNRTPFLASPEFLARLLAGKQADARLFARNLLTSVPLEDSFLHTLASRVLAEITALGATQSDIAKEAADFSLLLLARPLRSIDVQALLPLLSHPLEAVQEFGAQLLLNHDKPAGELPETLIISLIESAFPAVRASGALLFGKLTDAQLVEREAALFSFVQHPQPEIRNGIRPALKRLVESGRYAEFARRFGLRLVTLLLAPETVEGSHSRVIPVVKEDLGTAWLQAVSFDTAWNLVHGKSTAAQDFGGWLLAHSADNWVLDVVLESLVTLCNHEVLAVRTGVQSLIQMRLPILHRNHEEMAVAVRILDSKWDDFRGWAFDFFRKEFSAPDFTPEILISMCDSIRPDVQAFGRELMTKYFTEEAGQEYLLKLSEHPSVPMQQFATNFLERYAADNPERLHRLEPYFVGVLSRVNQGGTAKRRILTFLSAEGLKNEAAARLVTDILTRQSVTASVRDKAAAIEALTLIQQRFPEIPSLLRVKPVEARN